MISNITENMLMAALRKWGGIQALAAKELKTTRQNVHQRIKGSPALQTLLAEIEDENLDIGEGHILKGLRAGDKEMVRYYMDRKGRKRGYGNSVSVGTDEATLEAVVATLGGDPAALRAALARLGVAQTEIP